MVEPSTDTKLHGPERIARNFVHSNLHDPTQARAQGFRGAVVGVSYNLWHPSSLFENYLGERWLEQGRLQVRFTAPVYEGDRLQPLARIQGTGANFASTWFVINQDKATVMEGQASWTPQNDPVPDLDETEANEHTEFIALSNFIVGERLESEVQTNAEILSEYCRRNDDPRAEENRIPFSYLPVLMFQPVRVRLNEYGIGGALFGKLDIRVHQQLRRDMTYEHTSQILGLRQRGQLEFIDLELRAFEAGSLVCAITQTHIIPHRDRPIAGKMSPGTHSTS